VRKACWASMSDDRKRLLQLRLKRLHQLRRVALAFIYLGRMATVCLAFLICVSLLFSLQERFAYGLAVNWSPSMPVGLYWFHPAVELKRGDWVSVCISSENASLYQSRGYLPDREGCASGIAPVFKPIAASPGDSVSLEQDGVRVNGALVPGSVALDLDAAGRPMPHLPPGWSRRLGPGEYFVLATFHPRSLDSRYYGWVMRSQILHQVFPIFIRRGF
jgi:conjugative transfer signal peptidase TraF